MGRTVWELFDLEDRVALVTGATGQLGPEICHALAEAGANVAVNARSPEDCTALAEELTSTHTESIPAVADVTDQAAVSEMVENVVDRFGQIDVLVNNATSGGAFGVPFEEIPREEWEAGIEGVLTQVFLCSQAVVGQMRRQNSGSIVNVGSHLGLVAADQDLYSELDRNSPPSYGVGKAGVIQFTRWLATYLAEDGIRVNCISPAGIYNEDLADEPGYRSDFVPRYRERIPLGRMGEPTDLKGTVVLLASDAGKWMTGENVVIDGGYTIHA